MDSPSPSMAVRNASGKRRSVRAYAAGTLDRATIEESLRAAVRAPTAVHGEHYRADHRGEACRRNTDHLAEGAARRGMALSARMPRR